MGSSLMKKQWLCLASFVSDFRAIWSDLWAVEESLALVLREGP